jgi:hypothetical protein
MFTNSIDNKPTFLRNDDLEIKDLTVSMFNLNAITSYPKYNVYRVPKDFEMRPDLIAAAVYNNSAYAELILKFNGISNPFSIKEGDLILVPTLDSAQTMLSTTTSGALTSGSNMIRNSYKYIDPTKMPKSDDSNFQNRQLVGGAKEGALPPNLTQEGEEQITYRNGRVYFGASVETCLKNGMTQSEFLTNVIKSKV